MSQIKNDKHPVSAGSNPLALGRIQKSLGSAKALNGERTQEKRLTLHCARLFTATSRHGVAGPRCKTTTPSTFAYRI
eukprot:5479808-Amphidinium_carterae.1